MQIEYFTDARTKDMVYRMHSAGTSISDQTMEFITWCKHFDIMGSDVLYADIFKLDGFELAASLSLRGDGVVEIIPPDGRKINPFKRKISPFKRMKALFINIKMASKDDSLENFIKGLLEEG